MKKYSLYENRISLILLSAYIFVVLCLDSFLIFYNTKIYLFIASLFVIAAVSVFLSSFILKTLSKKSIDQENTYLSKKQSIKWYFIFFIISISAMLIVYIAYYPGAYSFDSYNQYLQAVKNEYNDWHPIIQTLITHKLPIILTNGWFGSIALFQMLELSLALSYMSITVLKYAGKKFALITFLLVVFNPQTSKVIYPWKDVTFAILTTVLMTIVLNCVMTKGEWMKNPVHSIFLIITLALDTMVRHNGVLFTLTLALCLLFILPKKRTVVIILCSLILIGAIKVPLYNALQVEKPGQRQTEVLGVPLSIIAHCVANDEDKLDDEILEFAYKIAPKEVYEQKYTDVGFNTVKFQKGTNLDTIEEYGIKNVLRLSARCFAQAPKSAIRGFIKVTNPAYTLTNIYPYQDMPTAYELDGFNGVSSLQTICSNYIIYSLLLFPHIFKYTGAIHLLLIASILAKLKLKRKSYLKQLMLVLPLFVYNFGTMLLMTANTDGSRFFYYSYCILPLLLVLIYKKRDVSKGEV